MSKPLVFSYKKHKDLREAYKCLLADNQKLMSDNSDLRNQLEGAKVLIYQQKHLVRCRDCRYSFYNDDTEYYECRHNKGMPEELYGVDFCSQGERKDDQV